MNTPFFSPGLQVFLAACFSFAAVFTGANGLLAVPAAAVVAALICGLLAFGKMQELEGSSVIRFGLLAASAVTALLFLLATWSTAVWPFMLTLLLALIPVALWVGLWLFARRLSPGPANTTASTN